MANTFRARNAGFLKPKKFFIVATEGAKTEKLYLDELKPRREAVVQVKVLPNKKHKTKPKEVFGRLKAYASENAILPNDELWLMIDVDNWDRADLDEIADEISKRSNFFLAISNPCIELWLYLHLADNKPFHDRHAISRELQKLLGSYDKGDYDAKRLAKEVQSAIRRAEAIDKRDHVWPRAQGTHVYRLIKKILQM